MKAIKMITRLFRWFNRELAGANAPRDLSQLPVLRWEVIDHHPYGNPKSKSVIVEATTEYEAKKIAFNIAPSDWKISDQQDWNLDWGAYRVKCLGKIV